jgi:CRISPR/Cas system-associated protein Cas10 (large subunit of type III CRISPR-Cas system)
MTPEQAYALLGAVTALVVAVTGLLVQLRRLRSDLNGRLEDLLNRTYDAAHRHGELEGRDFMRRILNPPGEPPPSGE